MYIVIIFTIILIALLIFTLKKLKEQKHKKYIGIIATEIFGIIAEIIQLFIQRYIFGINFFICLVSIIVPSLILILEKNNIYLNELIILIAEKNKKMDLKKVLIDVIDRYPKSYLAHKKLAEYYEKNNENEKAEDEYIKVISLRPDEYKNYYKFALVLQKNNDTDNAINSLKEALKIKPSCLEASILLGDLLYKNNDFKVAIMVYNEQLKYHPGEYMLYYYLGMCYVRTNDFEEANNCYKKAATINSYKDISSLNIGQINMILKNYEEAEKYFYIGIKSSDDKIVAESYYHLAKIKIFNHEYDTAIQYTNLALETNPKIRDKIERDEDFAVIIGKIAVKNGQRIIDTKVTDLDEITINHLDKTFNVIDNLADLKPDKTYRNIEKER